MKIILQVSILDLSRSGFQMAITKTEYFDGADSALTQLYAIRAMLGLSDISQVLEQADILGFEKIYGGADPDKYIPCNKIHIYS